jgi:hypothetical protein
MRPPPMIAMVPLPPHMHSSWREDMLSPSTTVRILSRFRRHVRSAWHFILSPICPLASSLRAPRRFKHWLWRPPPCQRRLPLVLLKKGAGFSCPPTWIAMRTSLRCRCLPGLCRGVARLGLLPLPVPLMAALILRVGLTPKVLMSPCPLFPPLFELVSLIMGGTFPTPTVMGADKSVHTIRSPPFVMGGHLSLRPRALTMAVLLVLMGGFPWALHFSLQIGMFPISMGGLTALAVCLRWCTVRMVPSAHAMASHGWCSGPMACPFTGFHMCRHW